MSEKTCKFDFCVLGKAYHRRLCCSWQNWRDNILSCRILILIGSDSLASRIGFRRCIDHANLRKDFHKGYLHNCYIFFWLQSQSFRWYRQKLRKKRVPRAHICSFWHPMENFKSVYHWFTGKSSPEVHVDRVWETWVSIENGRFCPPWIRGVNKNREFELFGGATLIAN